MVDPRLLQGELKSFSIGYSGLRFFVESEFSDGQRRYSINDEGKSLVGEDEGDWQLGWKVIGYEESCGDPIFVDTDLDGVPVFMAIHGVGDWNPVQIADSFDAFEKTLKKVSDISVGRENPVLLEKNPIGDSESEAALGEIRQINPQSDIEFWELLLCPVE